MRSTLFCAVVAALSVSCSSGKKAELDGSVAAEVLDAAVSASAKADEEPLLELEPATFGDLQGWADDDHFAALGALRRSCRALMKKDGAAQVGLFAIAGTVADWKPACDAADAVRGSDDARAYFEAQFVPHRVTNRGEPVGRFTGYYNARIRASRAKRGAYRVPIWGRPQDLLSIDLSEFDPKLRGERIWGKLSGSKVVPYETRREINGGALHKRAEAILWADDPIDVFFAEVQGSATIELAGGGTTRIGVAGKNGRIYTAIGRVLIADGELTRETVSMQSIREWMQSHPDKADALMEKNEALIFFRELEGDGPHGAQGVVLTPGRSLAIDLRWLPMTAPLWLETEVPTPGAEATQPYRRLLIAQDTGGAIRGPVRGDIYFGDDQTAYDQAGRMKGTGRYFLLLPR